jgi:TatD DNase family protein
MKLFDAHNHLQDERLRPWIADILDVMPRDGIQSAVVNGSSEEDWEDVARLAREHPWIKPSFGLHPWYVKERSARWQDALLRHVDEFPAAAVGEIGLDRWIQDPDMPAQEEVFRWQLDIAASQDRPATIHCLKAWGMLEEILRSTTRPRRGFLLHSYGGPAEMVPQFAALGAYFSLSPYFTHERKSRQAQTFATVPIDRLLAETDAPDMWPPDELNEHPLHDPEGKPLNHPRNLQLSYRKLAEIRGMPVEELALQLEENFRRLFGQSPTT